MKLSEDQVTESGERNLNYFREFALLDWINRSTPELMAMHTVELLLLLREVRKARSENFGTLHFFNRIDGQVTNEGMENAKSLQGREYEYLTKKTWVIENIIRDRIGYIPERMSQSFLVKQIDQAKKLPKPMKSGPPRKTLKRRICFC